MAIHNPHDSITLLKRAGLGALWGLLCYFLGEHVPFTADTYGWKIPATTALTLVPLGYFLLNPSLHRRSVQFFALQAILLAGMSKYGTTAHSFRDVIPAPYVLSQFGLWGLSLLAFAAKEKQLQSGTSFYTALLSCAFQLASCALLSTLTLGVFWLILLLGAGLFKVVGIDLFFTLFAKLYFSYPVSSAVFVLSVAIIQARYTGDVLRKVVVSPCAWLLPVACFIACTFLVVLPFTGLSALWSTGHATALMLALQLIVIVFMTSSYQDGASIPSFPTLIRRVISACLIALPIYSALCVYALNLRVMQHGWSVDRLWAAYFTLFIAAMALGYAYAAMKKGVWLSLLPRVNLGAIGLFTTILLLTHTPLLNPERITTSTQMARLLSGAVKSDAFDYGYFKFELGTYGARALLTLADLHDHPDAAEIQNKAKDALTKNDRFVAESLADAAALQKKLTLFPKDATMDVSFIDAFYSHTQEPRMQNAYACLNSKANCTMLKADLNADGIDEYILLDYTSAIFMQSGDEWKLVGSLQNIVKSSQEWAKTLDEKGFTLEKPEWQDLHIGKFRLSVWENRDGL